jgi:hypothetical protein
VTTTLASATRAQASARQSSLNLGTSVSVSAFQPLALHAMTTTSAPQMTSARLSSQMMACSEACVWERLMLTCHAMIMMPCAPKMTGNRYFLLSVVTVNGSVRKLNWCWDFPVCVHYLPAANATGSLVLSTTKTIRCSGNFTRNSCCWNT